MSNSEGGDGMNILEELYYGNLNPNAKCFDRDSEYGKYLKIVSDNEEKLNVCLNGNEKHLFAQLINAQHEVAGISDLERFVEGFRLGAKFMLDTFLMPPDGQIKDICT